MGHEAINFNKSELGDARTGLINARIMRLLNLAKKQADALEKLSPSVRKRVEILREIQGQRDELDALFLEERAAIVAKYHKLYEPLHANRCNIVNGTVISTEGVPDFWLTAFKNNPVVGNNITESDEGVLKYLRDIKRCRKNLKQKPKEEETEEAEQVPDNAEQISETENKEESKNAEPVTEADEDKEGEANTETEDHKEGYSKNGEATTGVEDDIEEKDCERCSFLIKYFFNPPQVPDDDDDDKDAVADQELQNWMEQDYYIGSTIGDIIIPHAVSWFTGEAIQPDDLGYIEDESDEDEEEDEDKNKEEDKDNDENKVDEEKEHNDEIKEEEQEGKVDDEEESNIRDGQSQ
ncbi:Nucleosome assembly protein (NAP) [Corchorus capsularis]|uniref:Nucleosome assembly protein (NAP) n=1 Tax=Corchorus capsularis TaxID=210143 RepID=A0A1R3HGR2_COCAP|nr:Nucleosome assembly protein (NAP) [Corchorus capsularis]